MKSLHTNLQVAMTHNKYNTVSQLKPSTSWGRSNLPHNFPRSSRPKNIHRNAQADTSSEIELQPYHWATATVIENTSESADGSIRTLRLTVEDRVPMTDGRRVRHVQETLRWIDCYKTPGQYVAIKFIDTSNGGSPVIIKRLLASSPYEARRESAMLDGSIIELLVGRKEGSEDKRLSELGPGAQFEVSEVLGKGYTSLFSNNVTLNSALEENRPLLLIAMGCHGIAPVRAALSWTPVLAHATAHKVAVFYVAENRAAAAYLVEWDQWREAGVSVHPLYLEDADGSSPEHLLENAIFESQGGVAGVLGPRAKEASVLMSGLPGDIAAHLTRKLTHEGIPSERLLLCEYLM